MSSAFWLMLSSVSIFLFLTFWLQAVLQQCGDCNMNSLFFNLHIAPLKPHLPANLTRIGSHSIYLSFVSLRFAHLIIARLAFYFWFYCIAIVVTKTFLPTWDEPPAESKLKSTPSLNLQRKINHHSGELTEQPTQNEIQEIKGQLFSNVAWDNNYSLWDFFPFVWNECYFVKRVIIEWISENTVVWQAHNAMFANWNDLPPTCSLAEMLKICLTWTE